MSENRNRSITLAARPKGVPRDSDFAWIEGPIPQPGENEVLCKTLYLSLDPYMRGRMNDAKSYSPPLQIGEVIVGQTVSQVMHSNHPDYAPGDYVLSYHGWQEYGLASGGPDLPKIDPQSGPLSTALGVLGMPGLTAYVGLLDIGQPQPGNTVVVSAATGAVGSVVGQIAKIKGCRVVGVAGTAEKCAYAMAELGLDACVQHSADDFADQLTKACGDGVDIYYDNVGGKVFETVLQLLNVGARVPICGIISYYNATSLPPGPNLTPKLMRTVLVQRLKIQGFIVFDHYQRRPAFLRDVGGWIKDGQLKYKEDIVQGLDNAIDAFRGLLEGKNFGKLLVQVAKP